jgi:hypothetical protein
LYRQNTKDTEETIQQAEQYFLKDNDVQTIEDEDKQVLDHPITIDELTKAVKELPNNKTPGSDGLPVEFYKMFWGKIQQTVFESIEYAIDKGEMSTDQKRGVLTLIPKQDKDIKSLKNWRPLSLLNTDYKNYGQSTGSKTPKCNNANCLYGPIGMYKGTVHFPQY